MNCDEFKFLVHAYVDSELDGQEQADTEIHLAQCETCRGLARHVSLFREAVRDGYEPEVAPDSLKKRLEAALVAQVEATPVEPVVAAAPGPRSRSWVRWSIAGGGVAAAAAAALLIVAVPQVVSVVGAGSAAPQGPVVSRSQTGAVVQSSLTDEPIVRESLNWHRRQLPIEVTGPDNQRVDHWFKGKVDFKVRAPRFDHRGRNNVSLLGARLSNVREKQAAYVVYEVDGSKVSVLIFDRRKRRANPSARVGERGFYNAGGYNVAVVEDQGVTYSITSELPRETHVKLVNAAFRRK